MLQCEKTDVSEGIDVNKTSASKECVIRHYWHFKDIAYKFEPYVCNKRHDISIMAYELENVAILNVKEVDYRYILLNMTKNNATNGLDNSKLDCKGTL